ncbi:MAG: DEAD/DEAH box helicase family protein [Candidatus Competibacteraceae bacterium]
MVARNHQVLGVGNAVAAVIRQEALKQDYPPEKRLSYRVIELPREQAMDHPLTPNPLPRRGEGVSLEEPRTVRLPEPAHPELGKLGVFWHTRGSGKSYSMAFFAEKVRRQIPGNFTFLLMTDRDDLDSQIYRTFVGCGVADDNTRAGSGEALKQLLQQNHRYLFSLIRKFNQDVNPDQPTAPATTSSSFPTKRLHRPASWPATYAWRCRTAFIGFTGTPLFQDDELTKRIFGGYISRYDFKRSEEDGATVKLVYENRGEKLGLSRLDLNDPHRRRHRKS